MENPQYVQCDAIYHKCQMRKKLVNLYEMRKNTNELGTLGKTKFENVIPFFTRVLKRKDTFFSGKIITNREQKVVAVGDIHGDFLVLLSTLFMANLIDHDCNWIGNNAIFVQCGDFVDRDGRGSLSVDTTHNPREEVDIVQYMYSLNRQARQLGGRVISVLGNHELATVGQFAGYREHYQDSPQRKGWGDKKSLFEPGGLMAQYMARYVPLILQVNDFLFMHGGLTEKTVKAFLPNAILSMNRELQRYLVTPDSPVPRDALQEVVFNRELSTPSVSTRSSAACTAKTKRLFDLLGLNWDRGGIVVGHTVQEHGIPHFCSGKVWRLDLAMSEAFGRNANKNPIGVLEICLNAKSFNKQTLVKTLHEYKAVEVNKKTSVRRDLACFLNGVLVFKETTLYSANNLEWLDKFRSSGY